MSTLSRRRFLEDSMFAIAAAGAASSVGPHVTHAQEKKASPNELLGVLIVGAGGRSAVHTHYWMQQKRTKVLYICDPDSSRGNKRCDLAEEVQGGFRPKYIKDMREGFDDKSVDIVSEASPNHWHALCGVWAMQAGKSCYLEKPISHNIQEGRALIAASKRHHRCCQVGTQSRSLSPHIDSNAFIAAGGIGDVKFARGLCYKHRASIGPLRTYEVPKSVDYNLWSGPAPIKPLTRPKFHYTWHEQRLYGNGDIGNQGVHQLDIARWHLGLQRHPNSVVSYGGRLGYDVEMNDPDFVDAGDMANTLVTFYDYGDKHIVYETYGLPTGPVRGVKVGVIVHGTEGYLLQKSFDYAVAFDLKGNKIKEFKAPRATSAWNCLDRRISSLSYAELDHFGNLLEATLADDPSLLRADARCGHLSSSLPHLGNTSYLLNENNTISVSELKAELANIKSPDDNDATLDRVVNKLTNYGVDLRRTPLALGAKLDFDPETETFRNNDAGNELLTREYRAPFVVPEPEDV